MKYKREFPEIWHHGNILQMARDLCRPSGFEVSQKTFDPDCGKGRIIIKKGNRVVNIPYHLPEHPELIGTKLKQAIEVRRDKR